MDRKKLLKYWLLTAFFLLSCAHSAALVQSEYGEPPYRRTNYAQIPRFGSDGSTLKLLPQTEHPSIVPKDREKSTQLILIGESDHPHRTKQYGPWLAFNGSLWLSNARGGFDELVTIPDFIAKNAVIRTNQNGVDELFVIGTDDEPVSHSHCRIYQITLQPPFETQEFKSDALQTGCHIWRLGKELLVHTSDNGHLRRFDPSTASLDIPEYLPKESFSAKAMAQLDEHLLAILTPQYQILVNSEITDSPPVRRIEAYCSWCDTKESHSKNPYNPELATQLSTTGIKISKDEVASLAATSHGNRVEIRSYPSLGLLRYGAHWDGSCHSFEHEYRQLLSCFNHRSSSTQIFHINTKGELLLLQEFPGNRRLYPGREGLPAFVMGSCSDPLIADRICILGDTAQERAIPPNSLGFGLNRNQELVALTLAAPASALHPQQLFWHRGAKREILQQYLAEEFEFSLEELSFIYSDSIDDKTGMWFLDTQSEQILGFFLCPTPNKNGEFPLQIKVLPPRIPVGSSAFILNSNGLTKHAIFGQGKLTSENDYIQQQPTTTQSNRDVASSRYQDDDSEDDSTAPSLLRLQLSTLASNTNDYCGAQFCFIDKNLLSLEATSQKKRSADNHKITSHQLLAPSNSAKRYRKQFAIDCVGSNDSSSQSQLSGIGTSSRNPQKNDLHWQREGVRLRISEQSVNIFQENELLPTEPWSNSLSDFQPISSQTPDLSVADFIRRLQSRPPKLHVSPLANAIMFRWQENEPFVVIGRSMKPLVGMLRPNRRASSIAIKDGSLYVLDDTQQITRFNHGKPTLSRTFPGEEPQILQHSSSGELAVLTHISGSGNNSGIGDLKALAFIDSEANITQWRFYSEPFALQNIRHCKADESGYLGQLMIHTTTENRHAATNNLATNNLATIYYLLTETDACIHGFRIQTDSHFDIEPLQESELIPGVAVNSDGSSQRLLCHLTD